MPDSVREIGEWAFYGCGELKSIKIPDDVQKIASMTFAECKGLTINIPASVTDIDSDAFENAVDLTVITPEGSFARKFFNKTDTVKII